MKDDPFNISAIILAAGLSSRMGDKQKLVLPYQGKPLLGHMLTALDEADLVGRVVAVTGHESEAIGAVCLSYSAEVAHNEHFKDGLASSIKVGVQACEAGSDGILICHGDMPLINKDHIQALCATFQINSDKIIVPSFEGRQGNPVLWPKSYFSRLKSLKGDKGAKAILQENQDAIIRINIDDKAIVFDVDDPATFASG